MTVSNEEFEKWRANSRRGTTARRAGRRAEEMLEWACKRLFQDGRAWIRKTEPPTGGGGWRWKTFFRGAAPPDFMGFLGGVGDLRGRGVCFDLKTTVDDAFAWNVRSPRHRRTKERQIADLEQTGERFGALSGLLLVLSSAGPQPRMFWIDWRGVRRLADGRWSAEAILGLLPAAEALWKPGEDPRWLEAAFAARGKDGGS